MEEGLIKCKNCGAIIPYGSVECPECHIQNPVPKSEKVKNNLIIFFAGVVILLVLTMAFGALNSFFKFF
ncbi:hypothetical protein [Metabacillus sp. RGM 3146]|uniref:hypothetical protein n=1 Tax=Metabacillus sp. RGM 3146 TaxID=3401092 RepID=UPI003B99904A